MDRNIDLTINRDFRDKGEPISRPRSIFNHAVENSVKMKLYNNMNNLITTNSTMTTNTWNSWSSNSSTNSFIDIGYEYGKVCDCCGKDITRLPWQKDIYYCLCRKCSKSIEKSYDKKIPWK